MNTSLSTPLLQSAVAALLSATLTGCGGSSSSDSSDISSQSSSGNQAPTALIATQADVSSGALVTLSGNASSDPDGDALTFSWRQLTGSLVTLQNSSSVSASFVSPALPTTESFTFELRVSDGEFSDSATVSFQVFPLTDTTAPSVISRYPQASENDVPVYAEISINFDEELLGASVSDSSLTLSTAGQAVTGSISYEASSNSIRFVPSVDLTANTTYTVMLDSSLEDLSGNPVQSESWNFTTASSTPAAVSVPLEGYGTSSEFGEAAGFETCTVSNLNDSGPGSLRECILSRQGPAAAPVPRKIVFSTGGTITLASDIYLNQPHLTIDGLSAPSPGITIAKTGDGTDGEFRLNTWAAESTCAHDVLIQGVRFLGVWDTSSESHSQNAVTLGIDGEDYPGCVENIVFNRVTISNAQDAAGDIWGSAKNITYQYSTFINSLHPQSHSHWPGGVAGQERRYISIHHNLYAYNHERQTNIRGNTWDYNFEQNILHAWDPYGFGGGYATQLRCRNGGCPQRINMIDNYYTSSAATPTASYDAAILFTDGASPDEVYTRGNRFPSQEGDEGNASIEFPRSSVADITRYGMDELTSKVLPHIGAPYRTPEEALLFSEVAGQIESE